MESEWPKSEIREPLREWGSEKPISEHEPATIRIYVEHKPPAHASETNAREKILQVVSEQPGITLARLRERSGLSWSTMYHHVLSLEATREIETVVEGRRRLVYPVGWDRQNLAISRLLSNVVAERIARVVAQSPACSLGELKERTDASMRTLYYHLKLMRDAGLIQTEGTRRYASIRATPRLSEHLQAK